MCFFLYFLNWFFLKNIRNRTSLLPLSAASTFALAYVRVCAHLCVHNLREIRQMTVSAVAFITSHGVAREEEDLKDDSLIANKLRIVGINYMLRLRNTPLPEIAFGNHLLVCPHFGQATLLVAFGLCVR